MVGTLPVCALGIASRPPYGLVVTPGTRREDTVLDVETVAVLVLVATVGLVVWWAAGRSGGARRAETRLRHICFGNAAQVERLIEAEHTRTPGISRAEAVTRAVLRYERDNH